MVNFLSFIHFTFYLQEPLDLLVQLERQVDRAVMGLQVLQALLVVQAPRAMQEILAVQEVLARLEVLEALDLMEIQEQLA